MMIVLSSCSISWSKNNWHIPSTGGVTDSVYISIDDLKAANAKMVELKREKEINTELKKIIVNDSIIIKSLRDDIDAIEDLREIERTKLKRERNTFVGTTIGSILLLILSLL